MNMSEVCLSFRAEIASVWAVFHTTIDRAARTHDEVLSKTGSSGRALKALLAIQKEASSVWFERMTEICNKYEKLFASAPSGAR